MATSSTSSTSNRVVHEIFRTFSGVNYAEVVNIRDHLTETNEKIRVLAIHVFDPHNMTNEAKEAHLKDMFTWGKFAFTAFESGTITEVAVHSRWSERSIAYFDYLISTYGNFDLVIDNLEAINSPFLNENYTKYGRNEAEIRSEYYTNILFEVDNKIVDPKVRLSRLTFDDYMCIACRCLICSLPKEVILRWIQEFNEQHRV